MSRIILNGPLICTNETRDIECKNEKLMRDKIENHFSGGNHFFAEEPCFQIPHGALQQKTGRTF